MKKIIPLLLLYSYSALNFAGNIENNLTIYNETSFGLTVSANNVCSRQFATIHPNTQDTVTYAEFFEACQGGMTPCTLRIYSSPYCNGPAVALIQYNFKPNGKFDVSYRGSLYDGIKVDVDGLILYFTELNQKLKQHNANS